MLSRTLLSILAIPVFLILNQPLVCAQQAQQAQPFTRQDSLRGSLNPMRTCYDVTFYNLKLRINPDQKSLKGSNEIHFRATEDFDRMQVDLFENMQVDKILFNGQPVKYTRDGNAMFLQLPQKVYKNSHEYIEIFYGGKPHVAKRAPWDGGFVWKKDKNGKHWVGVAVEGIGASLWWPNKDHLSDEPDSVGISLEVPANLVAVSNGQLRSTQTLEKGKVKRYNWFVSYPINNYNVTVNIADYALIKDEYTTGTGRVLPLSYWVLRYNQDKAKAHFKQVKPMLAIYEKLFGPYPFIRDGYALVETPYWGMEHQSAIAYGNNYKDNNWGFDYIIIHESGHEYWGNSISCTDHAEMWIHESFCTYTEALYVEEVDDYDISVMYLNSQKYQIQNEYPMVGPLGVNWSAPDSDIYFKGSWMLHTLRNVVANDTLWKATLKGLATDFERSNVTTNDVVNYMSRKLGEDYSWFFERYLYHASPPVLQYRIEKANGGSFLAVRWDGNVPEFKMPVRVAAPGQPWKLIHPTTRWQRIDYPEAVAAGVIDADHDSFYLEVEKE
jgi:aminopeptidase N